MKKTIILSLSLLICCLMHGENPEKLYRSILYKYDTPIVVDTIPPSDLHAFWVNTLEDNPELTKFAKNIRKRRGAEKETENRISALPKFYPQFDSMIDESMQDYCDSLLRKSAIAGLGMNCSLHIVDTSYLQPFTALTEDGFAICIPRALVEAKGMTEERLVGYVVGEFVHGAFRHHERKYYGEAKQGRRNRAAALVISGAVGALTGYAEAQQGLPAGYYSNNNTSVTVNTEIDTPKFKYAFEYDPEQVYEADLIAYKFMDRYASGDEYINALRILQAIDDTQNVTDTQEPNLSQRIEFLKFVRLNPYIGRK